MDDVRESTLLAMCGPTGAGRSTVARGLVRTESNLVLSTSATTRRPRHGEDGSSGYRFVTDQEFDELLKEGHFLVHSARFGHRYGEFREPVEKAIERGADVLFDTDPQAASDIASSLGRPVITVGVLPPSFAELTRRLLSRAATPGEDINARIETARAEIPRVSKCEYVLVNSDVNESIANTRAILRVERLRQRQARSIQLALADADPDRERTDMDRRSLELGSARTRGQEDQDDDWTCLTADPKFCSRCGRALTMRDPKGSSGGIVCGACQIAVHVGPRVAVTAVVTVGSYVLLLKRAHGPRRGFWGLPGGHVERGESVLEALSREVLEETGIQVRSPKMVEVFSGAGSDTVELVFSSLALTQQVNLSAESLEGKFFQFATIPWPLLAFESTRQALDRVGIGGP